MPGPRNAKALVLSLSFSRVVFVDIQAPKCIQGQHKALNVYIYIYTHTLMYMYTNIIHMRIGGRLMRVTFDTF